MAISRMSSGRATITNICMCELFMDYDYTKDTYTVKDPKGHKVQRDFYRTTFLTNAIKLFRYFWELLIYDLIDNNIEFVLPRNKRHYGEYTICVDKFKNKRAGEEWSYAIALKYNSRITKSNTSVISSAEQLNKIENISTKTYIIYISKKLRKRLDEVINTRGIKIGKTKYFYDYVDVLHKKFKMLSKKLIRKLLIHSLRTLEDAICKGLGFDFALRDTACTTIMIPCTRLKGTYSGFLKHLIKKSNFMFNKLNMIWDGYYYFNLKKEFYERVKDDIEAGKIVDYTQGKMFRNKDSAFLAPGVYAVMRIRCVDTDRIGGVVLRKSDKAEVYKIVENVDYKNYHREVIKNSESLLYSTEIKKSSYWLKNTTILRAFKKEHCKKLNVYKSINYLYARYRFGLQDGKDYLTGYKRANRRSKYIG